MTFHEMWNDEDLHSYFSKNKSNIRETDFFFNGTFKSTFMKKANFCQLFAKTSILTRNNPLLIVVIDSILCIKILLILAMHKRMKIIKWHDLFSESQCENLRIFFCNSNFPWNQFWQTLIVRKYLQSIYRLEQPNWEF